MVDIYVTQKKYNIIYADPPWEYNKRKNKNTRFGGGAGGHYESSRDKEFTSAKDLGK